MSGRLNCIGAVLFSLLLIVAPQRGFADEYYAGKTIEMLIGADVGGSGPGLDADVGRVPAPMWAGVGRFSRGADVGSAGRTIDCQHRRQEPLDHEQRPRGSEGRRCTACNA